MASRFNVAKYRGVCYGASLLFYLLVGFTSWGFSQNQTLSICEIQGNTSGSPYAGQPVETEGIVHLDLDMTSRKGFFLQQEACDADPQTSDGIFVYLGVQGDWVEAGDRVRVTGTVQEYYGLTEIVSSPSQVMVLGSEYALPEPVGFAPPLERSAGNDYLESLEGMRLRLDSAVVVGPTDSNDRTWVVGIETGFERLFLDETTGLALCVDDGGVAEIKPEAQVGDTIQGLRGSLDFSYGLFCLQLDQEPTSSPVVLDPVYSPLDGLRIATFNLKNLFDTQDDPLTQDTVLSITEYERRLRKRALAIQDILNAPDLIAVQEVENTSVLADLTARPELMTGYEYVLPEGPDLRGIDNAILYRPERVRLLSYETRQGCTVLTDGLGPDGNGDPVNPINILACDQDEDGILDGNRLYSRPPLVAHFQILDYPQPGAIWLIANHWKSKSEDTTSTAYTLPRRIEQAHFVAEIVADIKGYDPEANIVVLGDLNDTLASAPLAELVEIGLINLWERTPLDQRYTYIYQGYSQPLDHILLAGPWLARMRDGIPWVGRINADYPARYASLVNTPSGSSDHDPLMVRFNFFMYESYLPLITLP